MQTVSIDLDGVAETFELDFENVTWRAARKFPEGAFPLNAEYEGKRYELYSDGSFSEDES
ncbi:MAG: hypothetical protein IAI49_01485 [Candidatus Eremiobacteraeota bacterium]|nr:hypothetical protein [Candidatus Eremiobacteraeota bacterium]